MTVGIEKSSEVSVNGDKVSLEVVLEHSLAAGEGDSSQCCPLELLAARLDVESW